MFRLRRAADDAPQTDHHFDRVYKNSLRKRYTPRTPGKAGSRYPQINATLIAFENGGQSAKRTTPLLWETKSFLGELLEFLR